MNEALHTQLLSRQPLAGEVHRILRRMIISGEFRLGDELKEGEIAVRLGVSRTPVREALRKLEHEGLVLIRPGYVSRVTPLAIRDLEEIYPLIAVLEGLAARLASPNLSDQDLNRLDRLTHEMANSLKEGAIEKLMEADGQYHELLYDRAHNARLQRVVRELRGQMERFEYAFFSTPDAAHTSIQRHKQLVKVLKKRDPAAAEKALLKQWEWGPRVLRAVIQNGLIGPGPKEKKQ